MSEELTFDEYRVGYVAERWDVSDNCARALQLFELGFSSSGAAKHLSVTESTVDGYKGQLMDKIHQKVVFCLTGNEKKWDVWGKRDVSDYEQFGYADGVAHAQAAKDTPATGRQSQIDPSFREQVNPRNKGVEITDIPKDLITISDKE